jgi:phage gp46-like protein
MANLSKTYSRATLACEPGDDSCVRPIEPTYLPGISVRHSPSCSGNICGLFQCDGGNWRVTNQGTLDRSEWIKGWIMTQLLTRGAVNCAEHPLGKRDGGWWADAFRATGGNNRFRSGSKLWALQFSHGGASNELLLRAKHYAQEALSPLVSWGIVSKITIDALYVTRFPFQATIQLRIKISGPGVASSFTLEGSQQPNAEWLWREYRPATTGAHGGRLYARVAT